MPKVQQPTKDRQSTRLPLIGSYFNRDSSGDKDQRFINMFPETKKTESLESQKIFIYKRPALEAIYSTSSGEGRGMVYFNGSFYAAVGNTVYKIGSPNVTKITMSTTTGNVGMIQGNSTIIGDYLFVCDGVGGWVIKTDGTVLTIDATSIRTISIVSGGSGYTNGTYSCSVSGGGGSGLTATYTVTGNVVTSISVTNPGTGYTSSPTIGFPSGGGSGASATAFLNAFPTPHVPTPTIIDGYILLSKGSDVYNCIVDVPTSWDASNYLTAEMFPDPVVSLARQNNQVVVFGSSSTEFFYDAANINGSPLSRNDSTTIQLGCAAPYAVYQNEKFCIFVAQSDSGGRAVWLIDGFQPKRISDEYVDRILDGETSIGTSRGFGVRSMGHLFYVLNLKNSNRTLVYDIEEKLWHEWSSNNAGSHSVFCCDYISDNQSGKAYMLHSSNGKIYRFNPSIYQDDSTSVLCEIITNKVDLDTYARKFLHSVKLIGDQYPINSITLRWSDDDYQTWSNWKTVTLSDVYPAWQRLGQFRRRAFNIKHTDNTPLRLEALELVYSIGEY